MKQNKNLPNIWRSIVDFVCDHWQLIVSLISLATLIAVCIWGHTPDGIFFLLMGTNAMVFYVLAIDSQSSYAFAVTSICLLLIWGVSALGISVFWCIIPAVIMSISAAIDDVPSVTIYFALVLTIVCCCMEWQKERIDEASKPENTIEVVINEIEKRDHDDIMVDVKTKEGEVHILQFSRGVKDAWCLEKGDSIGINILDGEIISFEKK